MSSPNRPERSNGELNSLHPWPAHQVEKLELHSYRMEDLGKILIQNNRTPMLSKLRHSDSPYASLRWIQEASGQAPYDRPDFIAYLEDWVEILDEAFFFGTLTKHVAHFRLVPQEDIIEHRQNAKLRGWWNSADRKLAITWVIEEEQERGIYYLEMLVHYMLHAFFDLFGCTGSCCLLKVGKGIGMTGHGPVWADVLKSIQETVLRDLHIKFESGLNRGIRHEIIKSGWELTPEQIARWHLATPPTPRRNFSKSTPDGLNNQRGSLW